jgi:hypothetical protein
MDRQLHRIMTEKSIIGFGHFRDLRVGDLISNNQQKELIRMYYNLEKNDFSEDVKQKINLTGERIIHKPGKNYDMYKKHIYQIIDDIIADSPGRIERMRKENSFSKKHELVNRLKKATFEERPIVNMNRNRPKK